MKNKIAQILQKSKTPTSHNKAKTLENTTEKLTTLHLRNLSLSSNQIVDIINLLEEDAGDLKSISFSYNTSFGDIGAVALAKKLPNSISEIGLVGCNISDVGGIELLNRAKKSPNLRMICIEQNNFSETLKSEFRKFGDRNSGILIVV